LTMMISMRYAPNSCTRNNLSGSSNWIGVAPPTFAACPVDTVRGPRGLGGLATFCRIWSSSLG
jgi:hypothetical protein